MWEQIIVDYYWINSIEQISLQNLKLLQLGLNDPYNIIVKTTVGEKYKWCFILLMK